jgi:hypothetical protein
MYKLGGGYYVSNTIWHISNIYNPRKKNPMFDYSTDEESRDFRNEFSFSDDDEDNIVMVKSLDYKLRARKASESRSLAQKNENKKARITILELPDANDEPGSGKQSYCRNRLKQIAHHGLIISISRFFSFICARDIFSCSLSVKVLGSKVLGFSFVTLLICFKLVSLWGSFSKIFTSSPP